MNIAIVAPSPVPFSIGGAENLWWGLLHYINQHTSHQAELVKLPAPERDFWEVVASYRAFSQLDLTHFDLVISTKYPAWMVQHPNHYCYLQHRLRGLYDTYHFTRLPEHYNTQHPGLVALQKLMFDGAGSRAALHEVFERLDQLRQQADVPPEAFHFPSPLAREVVHFLDSIGLARTAISKFAAIAHNVAGRADYFPAGSRVDVIYHPSNLQNFRQGRQDYLFTVSRLDSAKRISLLVDAMRHVTSDIELRIAGTGPDGERLRQMTGDDKRIRFLGFVNDREVIDLYADALAVPYVPYDEDYGLVTIEAMRSGKPVLTTTDSGGPNEFVRDNETGFSVPPDPQALAAQIDYLCQHRTHAHLMGRTAERLVRGITWENTVTELLKPPHKRGHPQPNGTRQHRRGKITVAIHFPVFPPRGGGQNRVFHLYRCLARQFEVELVSWANDDNQPLSELIAPGLREIRVPRSPEHRHAEAELSRAVDWVPITDIAMTQLYALSPDYLAALKQSASTADCVVASHPYLFPAIQHVCDKPIWYEAHNVEHELKRAILPTTPAGLELLDSVRTVEQECCDRSALITTCSEEDAAVLNTVYGADPGKIVIVPNGVDLETVTFVSLGRRRLRKRRLGIEGSYLALFMGSWHGPNLEAVRSVFDFARQLPDAMFLVVGSAGLAFQNQVVPPNVGLMGVVDDQTKNEVLCIADVALNPMVSGSGTNLKMLDYFAAGIPVISTPHGIRGLGLQHRTHVQVAELDQFPQAIAETRVNGQGLASRVHTASKYVTQRFTWGVIAERFIDEIEQFGDRPWRSSTPKRDFSAPC